MLAGSPLFALGSLLTGDRRLSGPAVVGRGAGRIGAVGWSATLALVADRWPPERSLLGVVGAVQEGGAVLGPLAGAAVLAVAGGHLLANLLLGLGLAAAVVGSARVASRRRRPQPRRP